jgi:SAM-dependent MidA family methyltransferase
VEPSDDKELRAIILDRIREKGRITFEEYMRACLYEPGLGYYTSPGHKVGAEGDFYTSINVHQVFGRLIAREICRMWETMESPGYFDIVEAGAGNSQLARDILDSIAEINPALYDVLVYRLVEAEPSLQDIQRDMLAGHVIKAAWSTSADLSTGKISFSGCLLSNELIDSFPIHLVEMTADGLREVYVSAEYEEFSEILDRPSTPELEGYLNRHGIALFPGQRSEINLEASRWLESVARSLTRGYVMTIDYGFTAAELYAPMRKNGTLLCYHRHKVEENPYIRAGQQDMTSHVDFTNLISRGEELGLIKVWFGEQYRFLMGAGLMDEIAALESQATSEEERLKIRLTLKKLILPEGGMGDTFKILIQAKGLDNPGVLCERKWLQGL